MRLTAMRYGCKGTNRAPTAATLAPMIPVANRRQHRIVAATVPADVNAHTSLHLVRVEVLTIGVSDQGSRQPDTPWACVPRERDRTCPGIAGASCRTHRARGAAPPSGLRKIDDGACRVWAEAVRGVLVAGQRRDGQQGLHGQRRDRLPPTFRRPGTSPIARMGRALRNSSQPSVSSITSGPCSRVKRRFARDRVVMI